MNKQKWKQIEFCDFVWAFRACFDHLYVLDIWCLLEDEKESNYIVFASILPLLKYSQIPIMHVIRFVHNKMFILFVINSQSADCRNSHFQRISFLIISRVNAHNCIRIMSRTNSLNELYLVEYSCLGCHDIISVKITVPITRSRICLTCSNLMLITKLIRHHVLCIQPENN